MDKEYYTAAELAKIVGVSYKTIRHYHEKGLISHEKTMENGYRLFSRKTIEQLQRILMLKYLDFSLDEIKQMVTTNVTNETFQKQENLLRAKISHLEQVLEAVVEIQNVSEQDKWDKMLHIMQLTSRKEEIIKQYLESCNLEKRINIHSYSTSNVNWYQWAFEALKLKEGMCILDVGCGNAMLWIVMRESLPCNLKITLLDSSEGMLNSARENINRYNELFKEKGIVFSYMVKNAVDINGDMKFDRIIANHMLYHVPNNMRPRMIKNLSEMLYEKGMFFASTIGRTHLRELYSLLKDFDEKIEIPYWASREFELENGGKQLEVYFDEVNMLEQENDLLIPDSHVVVEYVKSLPGNINEIIVKREAEFKRYLEERISEEEPLFIHKSTGAFICYK